MTETSTDVIWLTPQTHARLRAELDHLAGEGRTEIAKRIGAARDEGDLRENGGYHAAKEEQGKQEAFIRQLTQVLENATVETATDDGVVKQGMIVTAEVGGKPSTFMLASRWEDEDGMDVYSDKSPLGAAIVGLKVGDSAEYTAPNGKQMTVKVMEAKPYTG